MTSAATMIVAVSSSESRAQPSSFRLGQQRPSFKRRFTASGVNSDHTPALKMSAALEGPQNAPLACAPTTGLNGGHPYALQAPRTALRSP